MNVDSPNQVPEFYKLLLVCRIEDVFWLWMYQDAVLDLSSAKHDSCCYVRIPY